MDRVHEKRHTHRRESETDAPENHDGPASTAEDLKHHLDEILDEIDSVLEENAEEFVKAYVQKGGE